MSTSTPLALRYGAAVHEAVLRDEIIIVGDEQKVVARVGWIKCRQQRHAFPFLIEIIAVVRFAVVQSEFVELCVVVDVDERREFGGSDAFGQLAGRSDGDEAVVFRPSDVGGAADVEQFDLPVQRGRAFEAVAVPGIAAQQEKMGVVEREQFASCAATVRLPWRWVKTGSGIEHIRG